MQNIKLHFIVVLVLVFIVDLISQPQNEYISDANTVLLLHLNETSGNTVFDSSPYHNDGVIYGNLSSEGKFYGGMQFPPNNTDIGIQLPDSPSLNITGPLTIETFLKVDGYEQGGTFIIRHNEYQLLLGSFGAAGYLQFFKRFDNEWYGVSCEEQVPLNEWVHLAGVWDGDSMRIYINGRQPLQVTYPPATYVPIGQPILANYWGSVLQPTTTTLIDEIRISNTARIITSVKENFANPFFSFDLNQNFPNPFNPTTNISWQSSVANHQTLKVFDVLGNEVATLVDEFRDAGNYTIDFNASKLSSGVYFYQLKAENYIQTKKMILLR